MSDLTGEPPRIHGEGNSEDDWTASEWLRSTPGINFSLLTGGSQRLVVVAPHPDDEVLGCGGLIWDAVHRQVPVLVVSATDGEACFPGADPADMARTRAMEVIEALERLGVPSSAIRPLGLPDGGLVAHEGELRAGLLALIQPTDFVVATWEHDGHPDHEAVGRAARAASLRRGAHFAAYPIWAWHWLAPADAPERLRGAVRIPLAEPAFSAKCEAINAFRSQLEGPGSLPPILSSRVLTRFRRDFEVFLP